MSFGTNSFGVTSFGVPRDTVNDILLSYTPSGGVDIGGTAEPALFYWSVIPEGGLSFTGAAGAVLSDPPISIIPVGGVIFGGVRVDPIIIIPSGGVSFSSGITWIIDDKKTTSKFTAILTGSNDGLSDFHYILKSYNGTHYSGLTSSLNFHMPRQAGDIQAIIDRPNGEMVLFKDNAELFRGVVKTFRFFDGGTSRSFSISAEYAKIEQQLKTTSVPIETLSHDYSGRRIFKIAGYHDFKPGDSLIYGDEIIEIESVKINIKNKNNYLELLEI